MRLQHARDPLEKQSKKRVMDGWTVEGRRERGRPEIKEPVEASGSTTAYINMSAAQRKNDVSCFSVFFSFFQLQTSQIRCLKYKPRKGVLHVVAGETFL